VDGIGHVGSPWKIPFTLIERTVTAHAVNRGPAVGTTRARLELRDLDLAAAAQPARREPGATLARQHDR
jgi:hypothetical protein